MEPTCPTCHTIIRPTDYFCFNCGKNLHEKPLSTNRTTEFLYYFGSILLPPLGFWWAYKYYKQTDGDSKRIALICAILTIVSVILATMWSIQIMDKVNIQINQQFQSIQGF